MVLCALPATQGLYGFIAFMMMAGRAATDGLLLFGIGIGVGLACLLSGIRQGKICAAGIQGMAQGYDVQTQTMIYAALPEFYAILALVATFLV
jgi:V/A-type H+-transporting ATPase subunit K